MHPYPHHYRAAAEAGADGVVTVRAEGVPDIATQAPPEFDGPPGFWSPELVASIADCYVLSFRAAARASKLEWLHLHAPVEGKLERIDGVTRFTGFTIRATLALAPGASETLADAVLRKAKTLCLVTNSLAAPCELVTQIGAGAATANAGS